MTISCCYKYCVQHTLNCCVAEVECPIKQLCPFAVSYTMFAADDWKSWYNSQCCGFWSTVVQYTLSLRFYLSADAVVKMAEGRDEGNKHPVSSATHFNWPNCTTEGTDFSYMVPSLPVFMAMLQEGWKVGVPGTHFRLGRLPVGVPQSFIGGLYEYL